MKWSLLVVLSLVFSDAWSQTNNTSCSVLKGLMEDMIKEHTSQEEEDYRRLFKEFVPKLDQEKLSALQSELDSVKFSPPLSFTEEKEFERLDARVQVMKDAPSEEELKWLEKNKKETGDLEKEAKKSNIKSRAILHKMIMDSAGELKEADLERHKELSTKDKESKAYSEELAQKQKAIDEFFATSMHAHLKKIDRASPGDKWGRVFVNGKGYLFDRSKPLEGNNLRLESSKDSSTHRFHLFRDEVQTFLVENKDLEKILLKLVNNSKKFSEEIGEVIVSPRPTYNPLDGSFVMKYSFAGLKDRGYPTGRAFVFSYHDLTESEVISKLLPEDCQALADDDSKRFDVDESGRETKKSEGGFFRRLFGGGKKASKQ